MTKKGNAKRNKTIAKYNVANMSEEQLVIIHTEAYYQALKRIEVEKEKKENIPEKKKGKWYMWIFFILNILLFPWMICNKFKVNEKIYDSVLVLFVSVVLQLVGALSWLMGIYGLGRGIIQHRINAVTISFEILFMLLGSILILSGQQFSKETDSSKIYAYSASIIALISCIIGAFAIL